MAGYSLVVHVARYIRCTVVSSLSQLSNALSQLNTIDSYGQFHCKAYTTYISPAGEYATRLISFKTAAHFEESEFRFFNKLLAEE